MFVSGFAVAGDALTGAGVPVAVGVGVTSLVLGTTLIYKRWRGSRLRAASREEDCPWQELLALLEQRDRDRAAAGLPRTQATDEEFRELLERLPALADAMPLERPEDREFLLLDGDERRNGNRRWGNPTSVHLLSVFWPGRLHGLVVNRSTGGLGIFTDKEVTPGTTMRVRAVEAPDDVPAVPVEVRHCRKVGSGFFIGCQFTEDIRWNARVWFG